MERRPGEIEELDELEELEPAEPDELDAKVEVPMADKSKPKLVEPHPLEKRLEAHIKGSDSTAKIVADEYRKHVHPYEYSTRKGKTLCTICFEPQLTEKQKSFLYSLWSRSFGGTVTKEAQEVLCNLTVGEASQLIDKLRGG